MSPSTSPIPLYYQIYTVLRQRIADGTYPPGTRLQPEDQLASEFGVSRATIRQAVGELVSIGLVSRLQGRGSFVLEHSAESIGQVFSGSLADLIGEVERTRIKTASVEHQVHLPDAIAKQLGLEDPMGSIVRRIRTMDGEAFAYTVNYLPGALGEKLERKQLLKSGLMQLLESQGVTINSARQTIRAQLADVTVSESLAIPLGSPMLFVERLLLDRGGEPIELVHSWYRGDLYAYTVTFERDGKGDGLSSQLA